MGGDKGFEAGGLCFDLGDVGEALEEGEKRNKKNPIASRAASISVMGLVRRIDLAMAMMNCRGR